MTTFLSSLGYSKGDTVKATVKAINSKGESTPSSPNTLGAIVEGTPKAPSNLLAESLSPT